MNNYRDNDPNGLSTLIGMLFLLSIPVGIYKIFETAVNMLTVLIRSASCHF